MNNEVKKHGAQFFVVTLSSGVQVHPDPAFRQAFMKKLELNDLFYPEKRINDLGLQEGFKVLNLAPPFQAFAQINNVYLHGFGANVGGGHWNEEGHRLAGELIAKKIYDDLATKK